MTPRHRASLRVPNESDPAGTVGPLVTFPRETPFAFVSVVSVGPLPQEDTTTGLPADQLGVAVASLRRGRTGA